jgi:4-amino-4-deoxy-L-arabinose transferase-like glycosyltransferase
VTNGWNRVWVISAFASIALIGILTRPLLPIDETRYLSVAWEMYRQGDFHILRLNGEIYTQKPPLLFWLISLVWSLTGVSATAARLVGPAFAVGCLVLIGPLARSLWPDYRGVGNRSTLIMAGFTVFGIFGGLTFFDAMLAFAILLGIWSLYVAMQQRRWLGWMGFGLAVAFGVYAKGPVILIHLLPPALFYQLWLSADQRPPARFVVQGLLLSLLLAFLVVALWLVPALIAGGPEYRTAILWTQSAGRLARSFAHERPFWFYAAVLPVLLYPWFWMPATWSALRRISLRNADTGVRLCIIWAVAPLIIFTGISGKQLHYLIPELPATALLLARILPETLGKGEWRIPGIPIGLIAAAALLAPSGIVDTGELQTLIKPPAAFIAASLFLLALMVAVSRMRPLPGIATIGLGLVLLQNLLFGFTAIGKAYDTAAIAVHVARYDGDGIAVYHIKYNGEFGFTGRLLHPVEHLRTEEDLKDWICRHPDGVIFARLDRPHPRWQQHDEFLFRNRSHALWSVADQHAQECPP